MLEPALVGRNVLVIEDEYFLADDMSNTLRAAGATVLGPVPSVKAALGLLERDMALDAVVLDVRLGGEMAYPVADALLERGVPFLFLTGYDQAALPERYAAVRWLEKPVETSLLVHELTLLFVGVEQPTIESNFMWKFEAKPKVDQGLEYFRAIFRISLLSLARMCRPDRGTRGVG